MSSDLLARREREALCDLALVLGEDAPTLSGDWTAKELFAHLHLREHSLIGAPGLLIPPLSGLTDREMARIGRQDFTVLVERVRRRRWTPYAIPPVDKAVNTLEYFVHHEDLRRAQPGWTPRDLPPADESALWSAIRLFGRGLVRPAGVPVRIRRTDTGAEATLRGGADPAVLSGLPSEIVMFLYGRDQHRQLEFSGPDAHIERLRGAGLGL
ncbi:MAG: TIGR03085 family metal-binding protein [Ornithinibacter sp.]